MTHEQAQWARRHDWYVASYDSHGQDGHVVSVLETGTQRQPDGTVVEYSEPHTFTNYQALRAWAGY